MRRFVVAVMLLPLLALGAPARYDRALVLVGGSLRTAAFLGAVDGAIESGWTPDVVIGTCGGSLAAAIMNAFPGGPREWREVVESPAFFEFLRSVRVNPDFSRGGPVLSRLAGMAGNQLYQRLSGRRAARLIPDIFSQYIVNLPLTSELPIEKMAFRNRGIRAVLVAARVAFGPEDKGKPVADRKLYNESYFTDPETGRLLEGFESPVARNFPDGYVARETRVYTETPLFAAARASMSEPSLVPLMHVDVPERTAFLAGSVDSYPLEVAQQLGTEVVATASGHQGPIETVGFSDTFGFDINTRRIQTQRMAIRGWLDFTDVGAMDDVAGYGPHIQVGGEGGLSMVDDFPATHEALLTKIRYQWEWGKARAKETFSRPRGDRSHLRDPGVSKVGNFRETSDAALDAVNVLAAPAVAVEGVRAAVADGDAQTAISQMPYLGAYGAVTAGLEWLRLRFLDAPGAGDSIVRPPSSAWRAAWSGTRNAISLGTGIRSVTTLSRLGWRGGSALARLACRAAYGALGTVQAQ